MNAGIGNWLRKHSDRFQNKTALMYRDVRLSYKKLNERVNSLANALLELGVRKGDRVLVFLFNSNEMLETMFACAKIGAIFVPVNVRLSADEVEYIVRHASGRMFIYDKRLELVAKKIQTRVMSVDHFIVTGLINGDKVIAYEHILANSSQEEPSFEIKHDDVHMIIYTSGTTGAPKGVMLTHGNTQWNAINGVNFASIRETDITYTVAPLFHIGGIGIFTTPILYMGGTVILSDIFDPKLTLETIKKERVTTLFLVPSMWLAMMATPQWEQYDLSSLRINISGGAPCPLPVLEFFQSKGIPFYEGFGMTETAPSVSLLDEQNSIRKRGSVGKALLHTEIKIVDPSDREVPDNKVGELVVKGVNVFAGYWNDPEETKRALKDGWFYTGDLARVDAEGYLYMVDRKKDMIISGGENIYPVEIEQVLARMPNVKEVSVIGVPDQRWGESSKAFVVLKDPEKGISLQDIHTFCEGKLARFKFPKELEILSELPRNATGKVLKTVLRKNAIKHY